LNLPYRVLLLVTDRIELILPLLHDQQDALIRCIVSALREEKERSVLSGQLLIDASEQLLAISSAAELLAQYNQNYLVVQMIIETKPQQVSDQ